MLRFLTWPMMAVVAAGIALGTSGMWAGQQYAASSMPGFMMPAAPQGKPGVRTVVTQNITPACLEEVRLLRIEVEKLNRAPKKTAEVKK